MAAPHQGAPVARLGSAIWPGALRSRSYAAYPHDNRSRMLTWQHGKQNCDFK
jgi:hypothetical protein